MNIDRLRAVQAEERDADSLRPLPDAFYQEVADYLAELREQRKAAAEAADDPFGAEDVRRLSDEIETAEEVAEAIYERRVGKLVKRASLAAAGMQTDEEGLTAEEAELFADLVAEIEDHRAAVLASFSARGSAKRSAERSSEATTTDVEAGPAPTDEAGLDRPEEREGEPSADREVSGSAGEDPESAADQSSAPEAPAGESDPDDPERVTVRITRDVGEVFGVDERVYDLAAEDVVTLPAANAKPLLDRDAAEPVDAAGR